MRPLTETIPKPLLPLFDRPFLAHVLDHLARHGVQEVILSSPYLEDVFAGFLSTRNDGPRVRWITEASPLGTGGAIANAGRDLDETFLVLNGDILTDLDLTEMVARHRDARATATIALAPVEDARPYGLVELDGERVRAFREKPREEVPGLINAGTYVLEPEAVGDVPADVQVSVEREVFPALIDAGAVVLGFPSDAYWMDLGTPEKYLRAHFDVLDGKVRHMEYPSPHVGAGAAVAPTARLGRWVAVGARANVGDGAQVEDSVLLPDASVGPAATVRESIVGPGAAVGAGARLERAVLAEGAGVAPGVARDDARVGPGQVLNG